MTIERGGRPTSPVHLHVEETTPVHVHVKKNKKGGMEGRLEDTKSKASLRSGASNMRRSTATARSRSKSPIGPWVPAPAKTTKSNKYTWQGASHRLDIGLPGESTIEATLHRSDLSTDDEERVNAGVNKYEKKIEDLMNEVGTLKNEVTLQKTIRRLEKRDDELETSRRVLEQQEHEIEETRRELEATEAENWTLRRSAEDNVCLPDRHKERELLMKKLVEVEMDGQAAAKQAAAIKDTTRRLKEGKALSASDAAMLTKQKDLLLDRIADFEGSNRMLRKMLRDRHEGEADSARLAEQRDLLLKKLSETEDNLQPLVKISSSVLPTEVDDNDLELVARLFSCVLDQRSMLLQYLDLEHSETQRLRSGVLDKDRALTDFRMQVDAQRDENVALASLQSSLESTRGHLQKQLRQKEADCNRMAVQVRTLESQLAQEKIEVDHLTGLLGQAKEKADHDKEALKKATRVQKQRAARSEDALEQLTAQLLERDTHIAELRSELEHFRSIFDKLSKEKSQNNAENVALKTVRSKEEQTPERITELENIMLTIEDSSKTQVESATGRLHAKTAEASSLKLENERLKTSLITIEDKMAQADNEVTQLRSNLRQYETLIDEYRSQMNRSRREADDTMAMLDEQKKETKRLVKEGDSELDKVKSRLQSRLTELAPLPELLKTTELRLQDSSEKMSQYERRNTDNTKLIAELTAKVEHQADQMSQLHERLHSTQEESRGHHNKHENFERKLREVEDQNRELLKTVAKREEALHQANMRLDEKNRENASLSRQMESLMSDARRLNESVRDKVAAKDRSSASRVLDIEAQLSQARAEIARIKREKDEAERKFNSRLYDLKDRLEQSHSTNRSMQNYVQFLKNSYANVFGDSNAVTSSPLRSTFY